MLWRWGSPDWDSLGRGQRLLCRGRKASHAQQPFATSIYGPHISSHDEPQLRRVLRPCLVRQWTRSTQGRAIRNSRNEPLALACRGIFSSTRSYTSPFTKQASLHNRPGFGGELQFCVRPQGILFKHLSITRLIPCYHRTITSSHIWLWCANAPTST